MKSWTILALVLAVFAVFLSGGHTEGISDDFKEINDEKLPDSFENPRNNGNGDVDALDEPENPLNSVHDISSNEDDEPAMFKRAPWGRRRRWRVRFRLRRIRLRRIRVRRIIRKVCARYYWVPRVGWRCAVYHFVSGDEEAPVLKNEKKDGKDGK